MWPVQVNQLNALIDLQLAQFEHRTNRCLIEAMGDGFDVVRIVLEERTEFVEIDRADQIIVVARILPRDVSSVEEVCV